MKTLEDYRKEIRDNKCHCGFKGLDKLTIRHRDHDGGWEVEGFQNLQWLWVTCPSCGYQMALWKIGVSR